MLALVVRISVTAVHKDKTSLDNMLLQAVFAFQHKHTSIVVYRLKTIMIIRDLQYIDFVVGWASMYM